MNDSELLKCYAETRSEAAFAELVQRHIDLVYSAALRQVGGDAHLAKDVTQTVFADLARKASSFTPSILAGWLYTSTRFAAAKMIRTEQRRQAREQEAYSMEELLREAAPEPSWDQIRPVLDEAMHELAESERNAVLLRYFEGRQLNEVGARLGLSEDAARKRVGRALEKLRGFLARRGVISSTAALSAVFAANAVSAAPAGLAVHIAGAAVATAATTAGTTLTVLKIMGMTKLKLGIVSAVVVATVAIPLVVQHRSELKLQEANELLHRQNETLTAQVQPLAEENQRLSNLLARAAAPEVTRNPSNELLRLRGEVARLSGDSRELAKL
jgi:RNA polymerase sigma factor (sigma-70 family)